MTTPTVNLSCFSPSGAGDYAACTQRLVWDTDFPTPYTSSPYGDFGTIAHFIVMTKAGLNPPPPKDLDNLMMSAQSLYSSEAKFEKALDASTDKALAKTPSLPDGVRWACEVRKHDPKLLPERLSRKGLKGYGGIVDMLASDRSQFGDYKFVGRIPEKVKVSYLWQLASYSIVTGIMKSWILWTTRDGRYTAKMDVDWSEPKMAFLRERVKAFIGFVGTSYFRNWAYPIAGDHCDWCDHKSRCAAYSPPPIIDGEHITGASESELAAFDALTGGIAAPTPEPAAPAPLPGPTPEPAGAPEPQTEPESPDSNLGSLF